MFKPGDEKYKNLSLLFICLNGILFNYAPLLFLHIFAIERMKSGIIIRWRLKLASNSFRKFHSLLLSQLITCQLRCLKQLL